MNFLIIGARVEVILIVTFTISIFLVGDGDHVDDFPLPLATLIGSGLSAVVLGSVIIGMLAVQS